MTELLNAVHTHVFNPEGLNLSLEVAAGRLPAHDASQVGHLSLVDFIVRAQAYTRDVAQRKITITPLTTPAIPLLSVLEWRSVSRTMADGRRVPDVHYVGNGFHFYRVSKDCYDNLLSLYRNARPPVADLPKKDMSNIEAPAQWLFGGGTLTVGSGVHSWNFLTKGLPSGKSTPDPLPLTYWEAGTFNLADTMNAARMRDLLNTPEYIYERALSAVKRKPNLPTW